MTQHRTLPFAVLFCICIAFAVVAWSGRFVQDDAYITLSYAHNLVKGYGLVFNVGEYVEGFTSLLWTLIASALMVLGVKDVPTAMQVLGVACTTLSLIPVYRVARRVLNFVNNSARNHESQNAWLALIAPVFIAATSAVQYWSASAMEAPFFWLLIALTIEAFLAAPRSYRWVIFGMLALLTRPEAMLLVGVLLFARIIVAVRSARSATREPHGSAPSSQNILTRDVILQGALLGGTFLALTAWRWFSYDALLPNTFAAKTGFLSEQIRSGFLYLYDHLLNVWMFFALFAPLFVVVYVRNREVVLIGTLALLWIAAVVFLGGDVLRHERFLIPAQYLLAVLVPAGWYVIFSGRVQLVLLAAAIHTVGAFVIEREAIAKTSSIEQQLVMKMRRTGEWLKRSASVNQRTYLIAATTIGALKYYSQQNVLDMLGLTDRTIATTPEVIPEVSNDKSVTWKERKYNAEYVLSRKPDFIIFSTGMKPSAFAERALWVRQMYVDYYLYYYQTPRARNMAMMFRRKPQEVLDKSPQKRLALSAAQIGALTQAPQAIGLSSNAQTMAEGERMFRQIAVNAPPNYGQPYQFIGDAQMQRNDVDSAAASFNQAIAIDPCDIRSHYALLQVRLLQKDTVAANTHLDWVRRCNPVLLTQLGINVPEEVIYR